MGRQDANAEAKTPDLLAGNLSPENSLSIFPDKFLQGTVSRLQKIRLGIETWP